MSSKRRHNLTGKKRAGGGPGQFTLSKPDTLTKSQRTRLVRPDKGAAVERQGTSGAARFWMAIAGAVGLGVIGKCAANL